MRRRQRDDGVVVDAPDLAAADIVVRCVVTGVVADEHDDRDDRDDRAGC
jgi:hypothetical protein